MKAHFLRLLIALLCLQASWAQALHLSHTGTGHHDHSHVAAADHSGHAHGSSDASQVVIDSGNEEATECQQQHHHHANCVALIDSGQRSIYQQSTVLLAGTLSTSHARSPHSDIDKPKWLATTY